MSELAYSKEKDRLRSEWQRNSAAPTEENAKDNGRPQRPAQDNVAPGDAFALLRIPAFGPRYEVPVLSGIDLDILSRGVGHYASTAMPGEVGNFAIAGHRVTHGQPFKRLLELDPGDQIIVETRDAIYTYVLDEPPKSLTVNASASWVLDPVPGEGDATPSKALLTLTTSQDIVKSADRSIGFAHLASTRNKA